MGGLGSWLRTSVRGRTRIETVKDSAVQRCRAAISALDAQDIGLQTQVRLSEEEARALLRMGDKSAAETALKRRELMLRESDRLQRTKVCLLSQILLVETAETRATAVEALAMGVNAHKSMSAKMFSDGQMERLQEDLYEQANFETEVSNLIGQSFEIATSFDDETNQGIEKTLEDLQREEVVEVAALTLEGEGKGKGLMETANPIGGGTLGGLAENLTNSVERLMTPAEVRDYPMGCIDNCRTDDIQTTAEEGICRVLHKGDAVNPQLMG